ncbi:MAG: type II secretion system F family protein [Planctomycetaceae bacterium]|nr:type II secretion system F family protein [Planctomycetaceae bacterium]
MKTSQLSLEDIRNLSDEVRLIVRAGLPLEQHLAAAGKGHGKRLELLTQSMIQHLNNGERLSDVIDQEQSGASRMLSAAVAAGVHCGDLGTTIEMMGDFASDLADLRKKIVHAMTYPLIVLALAWGMFAVFTRLSLVRIYSAAMDLGVEFHPVLDRFIEIVVDYPEIMFLVPLAFLLLWGGWVISGRASSMAFRGPERLLLLCPGVGGLVRDMRFYTLTRILGIMIEKQMPLPDALVLAGAACGSANLDQACQKAAEKIFNGDATGLSVNSRWKRGQMPPLLQACLKQASSNADRLSLRLSAIAQHYRTRLDFNSAWIRVVMPIAIFLVVAGGSVVLYSASIFWPVVEIYQQLASLS